MEKIFKIIEKWILPPNIYSFFRNIVSEIYSIYLLSNPQLRNTLLNNKRFKNIHKGERCFIVANGPSVKKQNILSLKDEYTFFINRGWRHKDFRKIKPNYYCIPRTEENNNKSNVWLKYIDTKISKKTIKFLSYYQKQDCEKFRIFMGNTNYIVHHGRWNNYKYRDIDITKPIPAITNTPMMCIQLALYMGFKKIYLIGVDYDLLTHYKVNTHFYKEGKIIWHDIWGTYEECVDLFKHIMDEYREIKKYADKRDVEIINATEGGYLEIFRRKNLNKILST